jgi:hypothetical protein
MSGSLGGKVANPQKDVCKEKANGTEEEIEARGRHTRGTECVQCEDSEGKKLGFGCLCTVYYYLYLEIGGDMHPLALVSVYSPPDLDLLQCSHKTLKLCLLNISVAAAQ